MADSSIPRPPISHGLCQCGCGERAPLARATRRSEGIVRGEPQRTAYPGFYRAVKYRQACGCSIVATTQPAFVQTISFSAPAQTTFRT